MTSSSVPDGRESIDAELMVRDSSAPASAVTPTVETPSIAAGARGIPAARHSVRLFLPNLTAWKHLGLQPVYPHIPFIFVSGTLGEEYAVRALKVLPDLS